MSVDGLTVSTSFPRTPPKVPTRSSPTVRSPGTPDTPSSLGFRSTESPIIPRIPLEKLGSNFQSPSNGADSRRQSSARSTRRSSLSHRSESTKDVVGTLIGKASPGLRDGDRNVAQLFTPSAICCTADGSVLYIAEHGNQLIRRINVSGSGNTEIITVAGCGEYGHEDGAASRARFAFPHGMAISRDHGFLFVADGNNNAIRIVDLAERTVSTIVGITGAAGHQGGSLHEAMLNHPRDVVCDPNGNLYVCDDSGIFYVDLFNGVATIVAGFTDDLGFADGPLQSAKFDKPEGLVLFGDSMLFVADSYNHRIRKVDLGTKRVTTLCGTGEAGHSDGPANMAKFKHPQKLSLDSVHGRLYVTELNDCIRVIDILTGAVSTVAGAGVSGYADGRADAAMFNFPYGICFDYAHSLLYTCDSDNNCVRVVAFSSMDSVVPPDVDLSYSEPEPSALTSSRSSARRDTSVELPTVVEDDSIYSQRHQQAMNDLTTRANTALREVTPLVIKSLCSYTHPPPILLTVLEAVCLLLDQPMPEDWNEIKTTLLNQSFRQRLAELQPHQIPSIEAAQLHQICHRLESSSATTNVTKGLQNLISWLFKFEHVVHFHNKRETKKTGAPIIPRRKSRASISGMTSSPSQETTPRTTPRMAVNLPSEARSAIGKPPRSPSTNSLSDTLQSVAPQPPSSVPTPVQQPRYPEQTAELVESPRTRSGAENTAVHDPESAQQKLMQLRQFRMEYEQHPETSYCEHCRAPKDAAQTIARLAEERTVQQQYIELLSSRVQQLQGENAKLMNTLDQLLQGQK